MHTQMHTHTQEWLYGTGISNDKLGTPTCNFFAFSFGFVVVQASALCAHFCACSISGMAIYSYAFSCMCFHYFDLFNTGDERKVSGMFLHMHLSDMAPCECVWARIHGCVWWLRDQTCSHGMYIMNEYLPPALLVFRQGVWACCV